MRYKGKLMGSDIGRLWAPYMYNSMKFEDMADWDAYRTQLLVDF